LIPIPQTRVHACDVVGRHIAEGLGILQPVQDFLCFRPICPRARRRVPARTRFPRGPDPTSSRSQKPRGHTRLERVGGLDDTLLTTGNLPWRVGRRRLFSGRSQVRVYWR
jgi:hypothetical protein